MNDAVSAVLHTALRGLSARQRAIADNVANIQTPGFLAGTVDFETNLRRAMAGERTTLAPVAGHSNAPTRIDGNNVDLDNETVSMIETGLRYSTMTEAMSARYRMIRTALER